MATLLLADDSLTTQKVVNLTFADEGVEVITASDGDTALQLFHERRPVNCARRCEHAGYERVCALRRDPKNRSKDPGCSARRLVRTIAMHRNSPCRGKRLSYKAFLIHSAYY